MLRRLSPLAAIVVLSVCLGSITPAAARPSGDAESVRTWNAIAIRTLGAAAVPIPEQPLYLAFVHRAVYDAVQEVERNASVPAAVAAAAHDVLINYFSSQQTPLDADYAAELARIPNKNASAEGITAGKGAAKQVIAEREGDGRNGAPVGLQPAGPGVWTPATGTFGVSSWLGSVRPLVLASGDALRPAGRPSLTSADWARDYAEVKTVGSATSTVRTAEQTEVARFWTDFPAVQSQRALRAYSEAQRLDALATARLFALTNTASADALIACFDAKYHFYFWRPIGAIRSDDGNPATETDAAWSPLVGTPNHPEYPSAHGCSTTAIITVLDGLDGVAGLSFDMTSDVTQTTRHYTSSDQLIREVGNARIWGGIHYRFSVDAGTAIGRAVAANVLRSDR